MKKVDIPPKALVLLSQPGSEGQQWMVKEFPAHEEPFREKMNRFELAWDAHALVFRKKRKLSNLFASEVMRILGVLNEDEEVYGDVYIFGSVDVFGRISEKHSTVPERWMVLGTEDVPGMSRFIKEVRMERQQSREKVPR